MRQGDVAIFGPTYPAPDSQYTARVHLRDGPSAQRLVVVSNRVSLTAGAKPDSGGLAVAIRAALQQSGGIWFGWSGEVEAAPSGEPKIVSDEPLTFATLDLSRRDYDEYYIGYANRVLWPF